MSLAANAGSKAVDIAEAATASTTAYTVSLAAGAYYELPVPSWTGAVSAISTSGSQTINITERQ